MDLSENRAIYSVIILAYSLIITLAFVVIAPIINKFNILYFTLLLMGCYFVTDVIDEAFGSMTITVEALSVFDSGEYIGVRYIGDSIECMYIDKRSENFENIYNSVVASLRKVVKYRIMAASRIILEVLDSDLSLRKTIMQKLDLSSEFPQFADKYNMYSIAGDKHKGRIFIDKAIEITPGKYDFKTKHATDSCYQYVYSAIRVID